MKNHNVELPFFLAIEDAEDHSHAYYLMQHQTVDEAIEAVDALWQALDKNKVYAVYLYDAYCPECIEDFCDHDFEPATHTDFVHWRVNHALDEDPSIAKELAELWKQAVESRVLGDMID